MIDHPSDAELPGIVAERSAAWELTARHIAEFGEEASIGGAESDLAVAVLLLVREVRRLRGSEDDFQFLHIDTDLNAADDDGNNWTTLPLARVLRDRIAPGQRCTTGRPGALIDAVVLRTELADPSVNWDEARVVVTLAEQPRRR